MRCSWSMHNVTFFLYPYYDIENPELYNLDVHSKPSRKEWQYHIIQHTIMATPTLGMYISLRKSLFQFLRMHANNT